MEQTVAVFPTALEAHMDKSSQRQWQSCAAGKVDYRVPRTNGEVGWDFNLGSVQFQEDILPSRWPASTAKAATMSANKPSYSRQRHRGRADLPHARYTTTATVAEPNLAGQYAQRLASEILARIHF